MRKKRFNIGEKDSTLIQMGEKAYGYWKKWQKKKRPKKSGKKRKKKRK